MNKERIEAFAADYVRSSAANYLRADEVLAPALAGIRLFDAPLIGCSSAADPLYLEMKKPGVIGEHFRLPQDWLPEARTVISFFFPFTDAVRQSNIGGPEPSPLWLHGRIEGQRFLGEFAAALAEAIRAAGGRAIVPVLTPEFAVGVPERQLLFTSNWSERHVAYISGLGTFSLNRGLITEKGIAGRLISLVTDLGLPPSERPYRALYEYCLKCGACARRCPAGAITLEGGKRQPPCAAYQQAMKEKYAPRYGCGKCQVGVPCEFARPGKKSE